MSANLVIPPTVSRYNVCSAPTYSCSLDNSPYLGNSQPRTYAMGTTASGMQQNNSPLPPIPASSQQLNSQTAEAALKVQPPPPRQDSGFSLVYTHPLFAAAGLFSLVLGLFRGKSSAVHA